MTLIIAGHTLEQINIDGIKSTHGHGVFFATDSSITQNGVVVVSGFKKVYEMPIRVNGVNLLDNWFNGYHGFIYEGGCAVAFAGSTLVSQHIMNSIRNHLGELKPTYRDGMYQLAMLCETHKFISQHCDGDMFKRSDYGPNYLLTAPFIAGVVQHAIQCVLDRASQHKGMKTNFAAYQADFILTVCCPDTGKYHIYRYEIVPGPDNGDQSSADSVPAVAKMEEIPEGKVAVIGMRDNHEEDANAAFAAAVEAGQRTDLAMHEFITTAIRNQNEIGVFKIGLPAFRYEHRGIRLELQARND
ncbi:hypothetical protein KW849_14090 [Pseudomonas sp. PDM26]|uniref:hypothetical protein n=1 Tax=Pseudomonas sp. PDM26 TaxID=2854766 RepID=UPI001C4667B4|nr:hypothetical protein [Pseudomonas sp. PDM26]MBV7547417.1 hypothetical protein [Pseudomonas sp. PDM26]